MSSTSRRVQRVQSVLRGDISRLLLEEVTDPRLQTINVTDVKVTPDLRHARVFYECREAPVKGIQGALDRAAVFLRRRLGESLEMKFTPELHFVHDELTTELTHLLGVLDHLKNDNVHSGARLDG